MHTHSLSKIYPAINATTRRQKNSFAYISWYTAYSFVWCETKKNNGIHRVALNHRVLASPPKIIKRYKFSLLGYTIYGTCKEIALRCNSLKKQNKEPWRSGATWGRLRRQIRNSGFCTDGFSSLLLSLLIQLFLSFLACLWTVTLAEMSFYGASDS